MRAYHFINVQYGLDDIRRRRLKVSRLEDLNDPFELFSIELSSKAMRTAFSALKAQLHKNRGILCFSERWDNPVMWSHYADKHKGICLEFEVPTDLLTKISYSPSRLKNQIENLVRAKDSNAEIAMSRVLTTKFSHWKYEKERRIFVNLETAEDDGLYYADFSDHLKLTGVIVGARSSISRAELNEALDSGQI